MRLLIVHLRFLCFLLFNSESLFMVSAVQERCSWLIASLRFDG